MDKRFTNISLIISTIILIYIGFWYYPKWEMKGTEATISWDVSGYYQYLPAFLIYDDVKQQAFSEKLRSQYEYSPITDQFYTHKNGNKVMKYSAGMAVLYLPAFTFAHIYCSKVPEHPADGYSPPYQFALMLQGLLVTILGLWLLSKFLRKYFTDSATGLTILTITTATNLLEYGAITNAMSHNYLFLGYTLILYLSDKYYQQPSMGKALGIALTLGLMALARPTEILAILIPITYGLLPKWASIRGRLIIFLHQWRHYSLAGLLIIAIGSIQLFYWKYVTGQWVEYSYGDQSFSWLSPHIKDGLFSFKAGWLIYTPVMILSILGFLPLFKQHSRLFYFSLGYFLLFTYVAFAWDIWWYGGSLGQRTMVQIYPILAVPMAAFFQSILSRHLLFIPTIAFLLATVYHNYWLIHQAHKGGLLRPGEMTKSYYMAILGRSHVHPYTEKLLDGTTLYLKSIPVADTLYISKQKFCLSESVQNSEIHYLTLPSTVGNLRVTTTSKTTNKEYETWKMTLVIVQFFDGEEMIHEEILRLQRFLREGKEQKIWLDAKIPKKATTARISYWNAGSPKEICISKIEVLQYLPQ